MAIFDATKSAPVANSYATVDEADDYFELDVNGDEWLALSDDAKEKYLATATRMLDQLTVLYDKATEAQSLKFPVTNTLDPDDDGFDAARRACIVQAGWLLKSNAEVQEARRAAIAGIQSETLGKVQRTITGYAPITAYSPTALNELKGFLKTTLEARR